MFLEHSQLEGIEDNDVLWKFMSFSKFVSLLTSNTIWFNRIDNFEDVFEGKYPISNSKLRKEIYNDELGEIPKEQYDVMQNYVLKNLYVCCFHKNEYESAAMWKLYSDDEGIAIQTTGDLLKRCFNVEERKIYISNVNYIDYNNDFLPEGNLFYLGTHKRKSFLHENEIRCLFLNQDNDLDYKNGIGIKIDINVLINKVYISPYAQKYLKRTIESLKEKYNCTGEIITSDLYTLK